MERALWTGALVGLAVAVWPASAWAGQPVARASAEKLLETITVPAGKPAVPSRTTLVNGRRYRVVASGSFTEAGSVRTTQDGPFSYTATYDALYCYVGPKFPDLPSPGCSAQPERNTLWNLKIGQGAERFLYTLGDSHPPPAYNGNTHTYEQRFTADASGKLTIIPHVSIVHPTYSGSLTYKLYGEPTAGPTRSCPAVRAMRVAVASANCDWEVEFSFLEKGFPTSADSPPSHLTDVLITGSGHISFERKPVGDAAVHGTLSTGVVIHTYYLGELGDEHSYEIDLEAAGPGLYRKLGARRAVGLDLKVVQSTDANCPSGAVVRLNVEDNRGAFGRPDAIYFTSVTGPRCIVGRMFGRLKFLGGSRSHVSALIGDPHNPDLD